VYFQASILNSNGEEKYTLSYNCLFDCSLVTSKVGWPKFFERTVLLDDSNNILNDDALNLSFEVILFTMIQRTFLKLDLFQIRFEYQDKFLPEKFWKDQSSYELKQILQSRLFPDLTIKVQDHSQEIRANKLLLAEASPVFYEKLLSNQNFIY
jgi:hypothetical protein